ncbi:MAG TPA: response regulator [Caulobacterales bacterium]|jgi:two-component system OmpR family response regulator|nr:response regulator [Caulobacterales bacterium]
MIETMPTAVEQQNILIVDDDPELRRLIGEFLGKHGFDVALAPDAKGMDAVLDRQRVDLIVLDLMMPGEDGLSVCRRISASRRIPVVMLSAASEETDRIVGLEVGADDYVRKPCSPRELLARIRAVLRRAADRNDAPELSGDHDIYEFADWRLDMMRRELRSPDGVLVNLSSGEFALLRAFLEHPQRVLTRDQLLDYARGRDAFAYDRAIDVQVSRLRRKLESASSETELIKTVRNEGYVFASPVRRP